MNDEIRVVDWSSGVATAFCCAAAYNSDGHTHAACRTVVAHISDLHTRLLPPGGERRQQWGHIDVESGGAVIFHTREALDEFVERTTYDRSAFESPEHEHVIAVRTITEWPDDSPIAQVVGRWEPTVDVPSASRP